MSMMDRVLEEAEIQLRDRGRVPTPVEIAEHGKGLLTDYAEYGRDCPGQPLDFEAFLEYCEANAIRICGECGSGEVGDRFCGDEGITVCQECMTVEGDTYYVSPYEYERRFG